jgi:hypothetical protein
MSEGVIDVLEAIDVDEEHARMSTLVESAE